MKNLLKEKIAYTVDKKQLNDLIYQMLSLLCEENGKNIEKYKINLHIKIIDQKIEIRYQTNGCDDTDVISIPQKEKDVPYFMERIRDFVAQVYTCF